MSISNAPLYGSPDGQRGYFNPQKVLATVAPGTDQVTVRVPPNAESLVVTADSFTTPPVAYCEGVATLYKYAGVHVPSQALVTVADTWIFDVSESLDDHVTITFSESPSDQWYVYADSGVRLMFNGAARYNNAGQQYVIPSAPNLIANDHPLVELSFTSLYNVVSGVDLLAAAPAGQRYRVFGGYVIAMTAGAFAFINDANAGASVLGGGSQGVAQSFPLTGLPLTEAGAVSVTSSSGAISAGIHYTTETV